jgi:hypothetical protein
MKKLRDFAARWWRWAALACGGIVLAALVADAGTAEVMGAIAAAGVAMPLIVLSDVLYHFAETLAYRALLGKDAARVPPAELWRSAILIYPLLAFAPMGRTAAEVARAASLAPHLGAGRAAAAGAHLQAVNAIAVAIVSIPCGIAIAYFLGPSHALTWLIAGTGVLMGSAALAGLAIARRSRIGRWIGARVPRLRQLGEDLDRSLEQGPGSFLRAVAWCTASRFAQTLHFGLIMWALGAPLSAAVALLAQGIHLVAATAGDFVPGQLGIMEGAYRIFGDAAGADFTPARAISISLLARISQFAMAALSLATMAIWRRPSIVEPARSSVAP